MIQGGDPTGTGKGGESVYGKYFEDEFSEVLKVRWHDFSFGESVRAKSVLGLTPISPNRSTIAEVLYRWPTRGQTPTAHSSSSLTKSTRISTMSTR